MRREDYERTYGRRVHHLPPPMPSQAEDHRHRRSRYKMKCLISIGLILPALAAVIGVAAWAVSADVVMNSGNNNRGNKPDNNLLQSFSSANSDDRRNVFRMNDENQRPQPQEQPTTSTQAPRPRPVSTTPRAPSTLSAKDATDVNAILSKLISASGAATGGNGPRFVVVAPLPDNSELISSQNSPVSRADNLAGTPSRPQDPWQVSHHNERKHHEGSESEDLLASASSQNFHHVQYPPPPRSTNHNNITSRVGFSNNEHTSGRRIGEKPHVINLQSNNHRISGFNSQPVELSGFEPFDTLILPETSMNNPSIHNPPTNFGIVGPFTSPKRGPPQGFYNSRGSKPKPPGFDQHKDQHHFNLHADQHKALSQHGFKVNPPLNIHQPGGIGLKPIQQIHHIDNSGGPPLRAEESNRWGTIGFHGPPSVPYVPKPPEGISLSISSPANSGTHVSSEPVSVIKSFFLPFLPKPRLNMNARVVFGVVLDKGMGFGGNKKDAGHLRYR